LATRLAVDLSRRRPLDTAERTQRLQYGPTPNMSLNSSRPLELAVDLSRRRPLDTAERTQPLQYGPTPNMSLNSSRPLEPWREIDAHACYLMKTSNAKYESAKI